MAVPSLTDTWKVTMAWNIGTPSTLAEIVFHVTAPTLSSPTALINEVAAAWMVTSGPKAIQSVSAIGGNISAQPYDGATAPFVQAGAGFTGQPMTTAGNTAGAQCAASSTKRTLLSGRSYRGRIYVPAIPAAFLQVDGVQWLSASVTSFQNTMNAWKAKLEA